MTAADASYDVIVIGGGINGAGIAREAALRGLSVMLLEARDFGSGTSSWSSRLVHGGLRYLEYGEIPLVYESLHERRRLRQAAPHLVRPLRLLIPLYRSGKRPPWMVRLGMLAYDLLSIGKSLPRHRMLSVAEVRDVAPGLRQDGLTGGATYYDAQVTFAERLVIENLVDAAAAGAQLRNYAPVRRLERTGDGGWQVHYTKRGDERCARAPQVVNAAGPWVDRVLADGGVPSERLMGGTKGSHIVINPFPGAPRDACYVEAASDGRPVFIIPWNGQFLIGTTDLRYEGDPGDARASKAEIDYLLHTVNSLFPDAGLAVADINYAYAGVRPLPHNPDGPESAITRKHILHRHADQPGLLSVIGGKLTTYRNLAEQVVDRLHAGPRPAPASDGSRTRPLPGGLPVDETALAAFPGLADAGRDRLLSLYGSRVRRLAELADASDEAATILDDSAGVVAAEVMLAVRDEFAETLVDIVHRRLMIGLAADQGRAALQPVARLAARELGWDDARLKAEQDALAAYNRRLAVPAG